MTVVLVDRGHSALPTTHIRLPRAPLLSSCHHLVHGIGKTKSVAGFDEVLTTFKGALEQGAGKEGHKGKTHPAS